MSGKKRGGPGSGRKQGASGISTVARTTWVEDGGTHNWLIKRLKGLSLVLIFWRTTVASDRNYFWTRYLTSSTSRTVSPTPMGATGPEEQITATVGEGTAERLGKWKENLETQKQKHSKDDEGISG